MGKEQLQWLEKELAASGAEWNLEPIFLKYGVNVVLSGHDHFYERIKPQKGIHYFVSGGSAKLRRGDIENSPLTAKGFDQGYHFMAIEITGDEFHFQVVSDQGKTVDSGVLNRQAAPATK